MNTSHQSMILQGRPESRSVIATFMVLILYRQHRWALCIRVNLLPGVNLSLLLSLHVVELLGLATAHFLKQFLLARQ